MAIKPGWKNAGLMVFYDDKDQSFSEFWEFGG
jgi:hypothetical protein